MKNFNKDIVYDKVSRKLYQIVSSDESNVLCQAPVSLCRYCSLCEEGKHLETIGSDGLIFSERENRPLTDKQIKMREHKKAKRVTLAWILIGLTMVMNFDFVTCHFGYWFRYLAAVLYCSAVLFLLCSLFLKLKSER